MSGNVKMYRPAYMIARLHIVEAFLRKLREIYPQRAAEYLQKEIEDICLNHWQTKQHKNNSQLDRKLEIQQHTTMPRNKCDKMFLQMVKQSSTDLPNE